jgi:hypothetical protein
MLREEFKALFKKEHWMDDKEFDEMIDHTLKMTGGLEKIENDIKKGEEAGIPRATQLELFKDIVNMGVKEKSENN